jgi:hypothetical protein
MSYATNWTKAQPQTRSHRRNPPAKLSFERSGDCLLVDLDRADGTQLTVTLEPEEVAQSRSC